MFGEIRPQRDFSHMMLSFLDKLKSADVPICYFFLSFFLSHLFDILSLLLRDICIILSGTPLKTFLFLFLFFFQALTIYFLLNIWQGSTALLQQCQSQTSHNYSKLQKGFEILTVANCSLWGVRRGEKTKAK